METRGKRKMGSISFSTMFLPLLTLLSFFLFINVHASNPSTDHSNSREALEIEVGLGIGGGGGGDGGGIVIGGGGGEGSGGSGGEGSGGSGGGGGGSGGGYGGGGSGGEGGGGSGGGGGGGGGSGGGYGGGGSGGEGGGGSGGGCGCGSGSSPDPAPLVFLNSNIERDYNVIQKFRNTITSDPFGITKTWIGPDICTYRGFFCDFLPENSSRKALASVDFNGLKLGAPTLENFVEKLLDIAIFHANTNDFKGTVSPLINNLRYLDELDLSNNKFTGPIPPAILKANFSFLDIRFNTFSGSVSPQIFTQDVVVLFLNNNNFVERLPENLGSTPALYLTLANNRFVGPIPRSIGKACDTLREVLFLNNQLSGCLPYEIGYLKEATVFDASSNRLTGPIPCSFGCLRKVEQLNFASNLLYGEVPEVVCALGNLANFTLTDNYFTSVGPLCWNLIRKGVLHLEKNCIYGLPKQRSAAECGQFFVHAKSCSYVSSFQFIPCKLPYQAFGGKASAAAAKAKAKAKAPSPSYSSLVKHR